ncbi:hypothetical protein AV530_004229 [Patagioenas fasciata monilis]|uniref:Uncharacterized protein n=1 Tax=Patagioenas fasciata monilis TaxID=372326 RepID=A0A1V4K8M5_PATFA|nr:hypothetical protein AV530_004229 [Patagioenas fasciata monilis]
MSVDDKKESSSGAAQGDRLDTTSRRTTDEERGGALRIERALTSPPGKSSRVHVSTCMQVMFKVCFVSQKPFGSEDGGEAVSVQNFFHWQLQPSSLLYLG